MLLDRRRRTLIFHSLHANSLGYWLWSFSWLFSYNLGLEGSSHQFVLPLWSILPQRILYQHLQALLLLLPLPSLLILFAESSLVASDLGKSQTILYVRLARDGRQRIGYSCLLTKRKDNGQEPYRLLPCLFDNHSMNLLVDHLTNIHSPVCKDYISQKGILPHHFWIDPYQY